MKPVITSSLVVDFPHPSLPVFLLLEPLRKRFLYHFCSNRQTNRPDKPEWMFSQILTWIRDHELFLIEWMQPVYKRFTDSVKVSQRVLKFINFCIVISVSVSSTGMKENRNKI